MSRWPYTWFAAAAQTVHLVVITGVEAGPEDGAAMGKLATALIDVARKSDSPSGLSVTYLADKAASGAPAMTARSTRDDVQRTLTDLAGRATPSDQVVVVLIGHGSFDGQHGSFNLPGPDLTMADWSAMLAKFSAVRTAVVNTASSSGAFLEPLRGPGRVIIAATRTGGERNETRFPLFFVEAFANNAADQNRDNRVSMLEAFEYARTRVAQAYQQDGHILTEHATLQEETGGLAASLFLTPDRTEVALSSSVAADPELRALVEARRTLEGQVNALRIRKSSLDPAEYDRELERLLTELALKSREIEQRQTIKPQP